VAAAGIEPVQFLALKAKPEEDRGAEDEEEDEAEPDVAADAAAEADAEAEAEAEVVAEAEAEVLLARSGSPTVCAMSWYETRNSST